MAQTHRRITGPRWTAIVRQIVERDGARCWICGERGYPPLMTADHVVPLADGGNNWPTNLRCAHRSCNYKRNQERTTKLRNGDGPGYARERGQRRVWPGALPLD
jgi:5-methylcytosine-specific restriction endonuclease McrA